MVEGLVAHRVGLAGRADGLEGKELAVHQVRRDHMAEGAVHVVDAARELLVPLAQHLPDLHALQVLLAAAQRARNDRELAVRGPALDVGLGDIGQRADHGVAAVVADQLRRHALQAALEEQVQEDGAEEVVAVVAQRDLVGAQLAGDPVQDAAAQPRAQAAHRVALGNHALDHRVGVLVLDVEVDAAALQVGRQHLGREARLLLVEVDRDDREVDRRALLQVQQDVEQRVAVLAAREADHDTVALLDHVVVGDRLADLAVQALGQLVDLVGGAALGLGGRRGRGRDGGGFGGLHDGRNWMGGIVGPSASPRTGRWRAAVTGPPRRRASVLRILPPTSPTDEPDPDR